MERRQFVTWLGLGFLASSTPAAIAACQSTSSQASSSDLQAQPLNVPTPPDVKSPEAQSASGQSQTISTATGFVIGTVADLDKKGELSGTPDFAQGQTVTVIRDPKDKATLHALNATCPHRQCTVDWQADKSEFVCSCHRGRFAPDGTVLGGPPKSNLTPYVAQINGDKVVVSAS